MTHNKKILSHLTVVFQALATIVIFAGVIAVIAGLIQ